MVGVGGSQARLSFNWPRREWLIRECFQLDRTGLGPQAHKHRRGQTQKEPWLRLEFLPKTCGTHHMVGGREQTPNLKVVPTALWRDDRTEILMAWELSALLKDGTTLPPLQVGII